MIYANPPPNRSNDKLFSKELLQRMEASCLELALEGERLCKVADYSAGVSFFEAAIQVGTEDLQVLSAIYSQLGNAYFHLHDYAKALEFHHHDLTLTRTIGDQHGEAKASGNLGNTLKVLGRYDEAVVCCQRHLDIAMDLHDKVGQARALYNFGNVYHAKGKTICWSGAEPGEFPEEVMTALRKAAEYYESLEIVPPRAEHTRLQIAKEFGDRSAERRAYCNLGNAYIFLGEFEVAAEHYKRTLQLARLLKDRAVEAQACYSLGNTYTLLQDYDRAIDYHLKHLIIAQDLNDRIELTARMNVSDLQMVLGLSYSTNNSTLSENPIKDMDYNLHGARPRMGRRHSMENLELMKLNPDKINAQKWNSDILTKQSKPTLAKSSSKLFFVSRLRSKKHKAGGSSKVLQDTSNTPQTPAQGPQKSNRMDDQRCSIQEKSSSDSPARAMRKSVSESAAVAGLGSGSGSRLEDGGGAGGSLPGLRVHQNKSQAVLSHLMANADNAEPDDDFFNMLVKCQGSRLDDQRCAPPPARGPTVPDEDFFSLIMRSQAKRMDEQRVTLPSVSRPCSN
ncbi:unnamed protein product [Coregonus sp. 'balchen']|nr:unnamed protein product [Coregonus sp. 'balchen']